MEKELARIKALADKNRLKIIKLLLHQDFCVKALASRLEVSESAVSQQLKILREADLVRGEKKGYYVHYRVEEEVLKMLGEYIIELAQDSSVENGCCHD
ncbi:MAG: ArsR/SmtB family transcription factor [Halanaerobiales bacterium]